MQRFLILLLGVLGASGCMGSVAPVDTGQVVASSTDEIAERTIIFDDVKAAIGSRDFAALSDMEQDFRTTKARTPSGVWKLDMYHKAVQSSLADGMRAEAGCVDRHADFVKDWAAARPTSPAPTISRAALMVEQAWCIRGDGYASKVAHGAWPKFRSLISAAEDLLERNKASASVDPEYYALLVDILRARGVGKEAFMAVVDEAASREPYYYGTYFIAAHYFLPQWFGSWPELDHFARYVAQRTAASDHQGAYARIFWSLDQCECDYIEKGADWPTMKAAMRDVVARYPVQWNSRYFADLACRMGDVGEGQFHIRAGYPAGTDERRFAAAFASCAARARPRAS